MTRTVLTTRTVLHYRYVDGSNFKFPWAVLLEGELSDEDIELIASKLDQSMGDGFIPDQVSLPNPQDYMPYDYDQDDVLYCELDLAEREVVAAGSTGRVMVVGTDGCELDTAGEPLMSCDALVDLFRAVSSWDLARESERTGLPAGDLPSWMQEAP